MSLPVIGNVVDTAAAVTAGHRGDLVVQPPVERDHRRGVAVARLRQQQLHRDRVLGGEARADALQPAEAADQQAGRGEQDQRQRDFGDDEDVAGPRAASAAAAAIAVLERVARIRSRQLQGRQQAAQGAGQQRRQHREDQDAAIDVDGVEPRDLHRADADQRVDAPERDHGAGRAAGRGQRQAFNQQLAHDADPARAERGADRHLAAARGAARQQQVGDVGARDQQHGRHRAEQRDQGGPVVLDQHILEWPDDDPVHAVARVRGVDAGGDGGQLGLRRRQRDAGTQPADRLQERRAALIGPLRREARGQHRHPDLRRVLGVEGKLEARRHDADDDDRIAVEQRRLADDRRVAPEGARPQRLGDHRRPLGAVRVVAGFERAAGDRRHAQQREDVGRDDGHRNRRRLAVAGQRDGGRRVPGDVLHGAGLRAPVEDVEVGAVVGLVADGGVDGDEARRVGEGQRLQQHAVDDAEDRGVGADAEGQHHDDQRAEARRLEEEPECLAEVSEHRGFKGSGF